MAALALAELSSTTFDEMDSTNGAVFVFTVGLLGLLACGAAVMRTRREASAARAGLLAEAGELLSGAQDPGAKLVAVATAAVPAVADRCTIDLIAPGAEPERAAQVPRSPPPAVEQALARVAGGAAPETSRNELVMPLAARGVRLGALELGLNGSARRFGAEDRALAEELARRCSVALDNARLVEEARTAEGELHEAYGLLDAIFERAPVGLAVHDRDLRYVRINDRMAEINGVPADEHIGRTVAEVVPEVEAVQADLRRVLESGEPLTELEVAGTTAAAPGVEREWVVSYWPVRRHDDHRVVGVGAVVFEVTERRAAERAVREQTARYESLLLALSQVGEAMVVAEADGRIEYANPAFESICGYSTAELKALPSIFHLVVEEQRKRLPQAGADAVRGPPRPGQPAHDPPPRRPPHPDGGGRRAARRRGPPPDGRGGPRRHRARPRRGRARAAPAPRRVPGGGERRLRRGARRGGDAQHARPALGPRSRQHLRDPARRLRRRDPPRGDRGARPRGRGPPGGARGALPVRQPPRAPAARGARDRAGAARRASPGRRHPASRTSATASWSRSSRPSARCWCRCAPATARSA